MDSSPNFSSDLKGVAMFSTYAKKAMKLMLNSAFAGGVFRSGEREAAREYLWSLV